MPGLGFQKVDNGALWEANLSQHQGLFQWVSSLHQVAKVLEFASTLVLPVNTETAGLVWEPRTPLLEVTAP